MNRSIDEYANSMFRFEYLHEDWIRACAEYLREVFADRIRDKVVLDYAFGRGNWSLAFLRAGASKVIAIDASESNVRRLRDYCSANNIDRIEVRLGNVLEAHEAITADLLWVYGILPNIEDMGRFLTAIRASARDPESLFLFYAYDQGSLRHAVVESCRKAARYTDEKTFLRDSLVLTPLARLRARDDLTAPWINWWTAEQLQGMLRRHDLLVEAQPRSFAEFNGRAASEEFRPHHFLCSASSTREIATIEPARRYGQDIRWIGDLIEILWNEMPDAQERRSAALGVMNTHFSALGARDDAAAAITEVFLFLFGSLVRRDASPRDWPREIRALYELGGAALRNQPRSAQDYPDLASTDSLLVDALLRGPIRI